MLGVSHAALLGAATCTRLDYSSTVRSIPGLLAYWRFSNADRLIDETSGGRDGTYDGQVSLVPGLPQDSDAASRLPGTVTGTIPHDPGLLLPAFTISLWVKVFALPPGGVGVIFSKDQSGQIDGDFAIKCQAQDDLAIHFQIANANFDLVQATVDRKNVHHIAVTADDQGFSFWVDGVLVGTNSDYRQAWNSNTQPIQFASAPWVDAPTDLAVDEAALYDRVLSESELISLSQGVRQGAQPAGSYEEAVLAIDDLEAYWRLTDASPDQLEDRSGNGHTGSYPQVPAAFEAAALTRDFAGGRTVDFGGVGYAQVDHAAALTPAVGSLSLLFKANQQAIDNDHWIAQKNVSGNHVGNMGLYLTDGGKIRAFFNDGTRTTGIETDLPVVAADEVCHVLLAWDLVAVWLYVDGQLVAHDRAHPHGLANNTQPWMFARSQTGINAHIALGEVALYRRHLSIEEIARLSEHVRGIGYLEDTTDTVTVNTESDLETQVEIAPPGRHIIVANGDYSIGTLTLNGRGRRHAPIVIRAESQGGVTFRSPTIEMTGSWQVVAGIKMAEPSIRLRSHHNRLTRCEFYDLNSFAIRYYGDFCRIDHNVFRKYQNGANKTRCITVDGPQIRDGEAKRLFIDHNEFKDIKPSSGDGASEVLAFGHGTQRWRREIGITVWRNWIHDVDVPSEGELISIKTSGVLLQENTIEDVDHYDSSRTSNKTLRISNWYENTDSKVITGFGADNVYIGNNVTSGAVWIAAGDRRQDEVTEPPDTPVRYLRSERALLVGNKGNFTIGAFWNNGDPPDEKALNTRIEEHLGGNIETISGRHDNTVEMPSTNIPYTLATKLRAADVGLNAPDPLVATNYK
ncbi:MAG: LamG-like jellyroll fold domain-containing protein [Geminicoccaceae bacterium]